MYERKGISFHKSGRISIIRIILCAVSLTAVSFFTAKAQSSNEQSTAPTNSNFDTPPMTLIDMPTSQIFRRGHYQIGFRVYQNGGGMAYVDIGLSGRFQLGISYGGDNVVSNQSLDGYPSVGFQGKFNLVSQRNVVWPSIAIGYSDQGIGSYNRDLERFTFKSRGFYGVASWGAMFNGWTSGLHAGVNYSLEGNESAAEKIDLFVGFDATVQRDLAFLAEYDLALNDRSSDELFNGRGRGYLNAAFRWNFAGNLQIDLIARDILVNRREAKTVGRELRIVYFNQF